MTISLFSGQGSQYAQMGMDLLEADPSLGFIYETASSVLGFDLKAIIQDGDAETLARTIYAQPAIMATSLVCLEAAKKKGYTYQGVAGHSLGEYAAMVASAGVGASIVVPILLQSFLFVTKDGGIDVDASYSHWRIISIVLCLVSAFGCMLEYYFTRERITEETINLNVKEEKLPLKKQLEGCIHNKYWWIIILYFLIFQFGQLVKNSSMSFYVRWMFDSVINSANPEQTSGALMSTLGLVGGIPTAVGMVVAWPIARKLGKKRAVVTGLCFSVVGGLVCFLNVHSFGMVAASMVLKGIGSIPAMYVTMALLSDVLDHLEAKNGFRSDGFTMSVYSSIMVGLSGLCIGVLNSLLTFAGYSNTGIACNPQTLEIIENVANYTGQIVYRQMGGVEQVLAFAFLAADVITYAVVIILMSRLDVEKHIEEDQKKIKENQKKAANI